MKNLKVSYQILLSALCAGLFFSCTEEEDAFFDPGTANEIIDSSTPTDGSFRSIVSLDEPLSYSLTLNLQSGRELSGTFELEYNQAPSSTSSAVLTGDATFEDGTQGKVTVKTSRDAEDLSISILRFRSVNGGVRVLARYESLSVEVDGAVTTGQLINLNTFGSASFTAVQQNVAVVTEDAPTEANLIASLDNPEGLTYTIALSDDEGTFTLAAAAGGLGITDVQGPVTFADGTTGTIRIIGVGGRFYTAISVGGTEFYEGFLSPDGGSLFGNVADLTGTAVAVALSL